MLSSQEQNVWVETPLDINQCNANVQFTAHRAERRVPKMERK